MINDRERARKRHEEQVVKFCSAIVSKAADDAVARSAVRVKPSSSLSSSSAAALGENSAEDRLQWIDKYLQGSAEPVSLPIIASAAAANAADDDEAVHSPALPIKKAPQPAPPPSIPALDAVRSKHQQTHLPTHFTADIKPSATVTTSSASAAASVADVKPVQSSLSRRRAEAARVRTPPALRANCPQSSRKFLSFSSYLLFRRLIIIFLCHFDSFLRSLLAAT